METDLTDHLKVSSRPQRPLDLILVTARATEDVVPGTGNGGTVVATTPEREKDTGRRNQETRGMIYRNSELTRTVTERVWYKWQRARREIGHTRQGSAKRGEKRLVEGKGMRFKRRHFLKGGGRTTAGK